jgi:hypothetical protein
MMTKPKTFHFSKSIKLVCFKELVLLWCLNRIDISVNTAWEVIAEQLGVQPFTDNSNKTILVVAGAGNNLPPLSLPFSLPISFLSPITPSLSLSLSPPLYLFFHLIHRRCGVNGNSIGKESIQFEGHCHSLTSRDCQFCEETWC